MHTASSRRYRDNGKMEITVIGAGKVGATVAQLIGVHKLGKVYLMDIEDDKAIGVSMDLAQAGYDVSYTEVYKKSDIVIIVAGFPREKWMERNDLYEKNSRIVNDILSKCVKISPHATYIFVTNPVDRIAKLGLEYGLKENQIKVMGSELDSLRFKYFIRDIAERDNHKVHCVEGEVIGEHTATGMKLLVDKATVNKMPIDQFFSQSQLLEIFDRTRKGGEEIINLCGGSAYAPAEGIIQIIRKLR